MSSSNAVHRERKNVTRDKEAKITTILDATYTLIETTGYGKVTVRDIARSAGVSVGLIYRYFPGGKLDIYKRIAPGFVSGHYEKEHLKKPPEKTDFSDFPGYLRAAIEEMQQFSKDNISLVKATTAAALLDSEIADELKKVDVDDDNTISEFVSRFDGVDIVDKNPLKLLADWVIIVKSVILFSTLFPRASMDDDALTDLMTDLSLHIWGYRKKR